MATKEIIAGITNQVRGLGANFDPEVLAATRAIYRPHLDLSEAANEQIDVAYGAHARHRLDVYRPLGTELELTEDYCGFALGKCKT